MQHFSGFYAKKIRRIAMDGSSMMILLVIVGIIVYFIPTVVAIARQRINKGAIFCMNLFLGWSFIGWVVALIWAVKEPENGGK
jgi:hypothetical protein